MMKLVKMNPEMLKDVTDEEIRKYCARNYPSGEYAYEICRGCGFYKVSPNVASLENAKIVEHCSQCGF